MTQAAAVLKRASVRTAGAVQLGSASGAPRPAPAPGSAPAAAKPAGAQARIVEQDDRSAVIEVICPCGCRTLVRCVTAAIEPAGAKRPNESIAKETMP